VQYVEGYVASNATETKIINQIEKVCNVAPKPISTVCDNFVAKHLPMVIAAIEKRVPTGTHTTRRTCEVLEANTHCDHLDPHTATVCTLVGLCTPKTSILTKFAAPAVLDVVDA
jgi:hypothetical protein